MASFTWPAGIQIADGRIAPGEPITSDLMHDYRDRDDYLQGLFDNVTGHSHTGAAGEGPMLTQAAIGGAAVGFAQLKLTFGDHVISPVGAGAQNQQFRYGPNNAGFSPQFAIVGTLADVTAVYCRFIVNNIGAGASPGVTNSPYNFIHMQYTAGASLPDLVARAYFVQASKDNPTVFILRHKITKEIIAGSFTPEILWKDDLHPFCHYDNNTDYECVAIELNRSEILKRFLYLNTVDTIAGVSQPMVQLIRSEKIEFKEKASPITPEEEGRCLHGPNIEVCSFDYKATPEEVAEYNKWKALHNALGAAQ